MSHRQVLATVTTLVALAVSAPRTLADASFDPSIDAPANTSGSVDVVPFLLAITVALAFVLVLRTRGPRALLRVIGTLIGLALGALFIAGGLFGDLSGRHDIFPVPILIGIGIIGAVAIGLWRERRSRPLASAASAVDEHRVV